MASADLRPDPLIGKTLPQVTLDSSEGKKVKIPDDWKGKWTILYFYPKDDTPGCTKQACSYRDNLADFRKINVQVIGVSGDDLTSHDSFITKFSLNFPLLADTENKLGLALGVFGDQSWNGKTYRGYSRDTFLVDTNGVIRQVWRKVSPEHTMGETYEAIQGVMFSG